MCAACSLLVVRGGGGGWGGGGGLTKIMQLIKNRMNLRMTVVQLVSESFRPILYLGITKLAKGA